ncbi:MAG TPA: MBL fold metallo-hydrolase [Acidimicrobiia bacterium]|nr:MBL fold metallo-hydrolase [Acidimicrobiia bacterium]
MLIVGRSLWLAETNCYLIAAETGGTGILVDAPPDPDAIATLITQFDVTPVALLLTHGHVDHMGGAGSVHRRHGATVYVHRDDDYLTLAPEQQLRSIFGLVPEGDFQPPEKLEGLTSGQELNLAGIRLEVRHTPGHTPGHCCFYLSGEGVIFSGDQLFAGSVGRTDLPGGSWEDLLTSMKRELLTLDDEIRVLPGHGPETSIGRERRSNPFLVGLGDR